MIKVFLMYRDQDFDLQRPLPWNEPTLTQDLELNTLFEAMALGDKHVFEVVRRAVLCGLTDLDAIRYRQDILKDCLKNPAIVRDIYQTSVDSVENKTRSWFGFWGHYPSGILNGAIDMLQMFMGLLKKLRNIADEHAFRFESQGFRAFFEMLKRELNDEYLAEIQDHLTMLKFKDGVLLRATLGKGNEGANYMLCKPEGKNQTWMQRFFGKKSKTYTFSVHPRDEHGFRTLATLRDRGINLVANALAQSCDHIDSFFEMLRTELAFYIGCLNLYEQLAGMGEPVCFPVPSGLESRGHSFKGLYDVCLALTMKKKVVGNDLEGDGKDLVIITGANQGGKSVFMRSIGISQLMMQCGMFVPAESFHANVCQGLFTHYKREEDALMKSGKFDEELSRMNDIITHITTHSMVLFNESFAATNEREGSEIARQIVAALLEKRMKVFFVTHQYTFAYGFYSKKMSNALFLRAEREPNGVRTFKLVPGEPLETSYGEDLYNSIFGDASGMQLLLYQKPVAARAG